MSVEKQDRNLYVAIVVASLAMSLAVLVGGCTTAQRAWIVNEIDDWAWDGDVPEEVRPSPEPSANWRSDLHRLPAKDGVVSFRTRNLSIPVGDGKNKDGGMEWIIAHVRGSGYKRLLIMVMGGNRPASRIYFDGEETNSRWRMPLMETARWEVKTSDGALRIFLNGSEIWSKAGSFTVDYAVMNGYPNRGSTGEWSN